MKKILLCIPLLLAAMYGFGHTINYTIDYGAASTNYFWQYLALGYKHILPLGMDHILFILCIFFLNKNLRSVLMQASMFTLAHSITLALTAMGVINPPGAIVEILIAVSIAVLAIENMYATQVSKARMLTIFLFGLVHGMGFAGALSEAGIPAQAMLTSVIAFNVGVELGQFTIIMLAFVGISYSFSKKVWYRRRIVIPISAIVLVISLYWVFERLEAIQFL